MTNLEMTFEEAIENRDALWVLYMIAERKRIAQMFRDARHKSILEMPTPDELADQILKERVKWLNT